MDATSIEYVLAAAEHLNFTRAAEALYVSQSTVSKRIANLERELNVTIFNRIGKHIELTEDGQILVDCFTSCRASFISSMRKIQAKRQAQVTTLRIGIINGWDLSYIISSALDAFSARFPNTQVQVCSDGMFSLINDFLLGKFDIIFNITDAFPQASDYAVTYCGKVQNILLFSKKNPIVQNSGFVLTDFSHAPLFYQGSFPSIYRKFSGHPLFHKEMPRKEISSWDSLLMELSIGNGYTICNRLFRDVNSPLFDSIGLPYQDDIILVRSNTCPIPEVECLVRELSRHALWKSINIKK